MTVEASTRDELTLSRLTCTVCDDAFASRGDAIAHVWESHATAPSVAHRCDACNQRFEDTATVTEHQKTTHASSLVETVCPNCDVTGEANQLTEHYWTKHGHESEYIENAYQCPTCDARASSAFKFARHVSEAHSLAALFETMPDNEATCPVCDDTLASHDGMLQHLSDKHHGILTAATVYACEICDATTESRESANRHLYEEHAPIDEAETSIVRCTKCSYRGQTEQSILQHATDMHLRVTHDCPDCTVSKATVEAAARHRWFEHCIDDPPVSETDDHTVSRKQALEALYNINKHAKKYARLGTENYRKGKKTTAKANSIKKNALYTLKENVLKRIYNEADYIGIHVIDGSDFYYFDFREWSFHSPTDSLSLADVAIDPEDREELDEFNVTAEKEHSDKSLKECLQFFSDEFGLNANDYLSRTKLSYGHSRYFIGWDYL